MKIEYDREVDALYVRLQEKFVAKTVEVDEGVNIDFDDQGKLIGLEILDATERYTLSDIFNISTENLFPENVRNRQAPVAEYVRDGVKSCFMNKSLQLRLNVGRKWLWHVHGE